MARHAVFTIVQDDLTNLRIWAQHYRRYYSSLDTYVLHHPTPGESVLSEWIADVRAITSWRKKHNKGFTILGVHHAESFDHDWLRDTVESFQRFLLQSYDTVLFTEVDEIVATDPRHTDMNLCEFLEAFAGSGVPYVRCTGYEVVHDYATEPDLDFAERPLLQQRTYWYPSEQYSKTLLSRVGLRWCDGFHKLLVVDDRYSAPRIDLLLLHLHKLDFRSALERHRRSAARHWNAADVAANRGIQNRMDPIQLREWWLNTVDRPGERARWSIMPDEIREIV